MLVNISITSHSYLFAVAIIRECLIFTVLATLSIQYSIGIFSHRTPHNILDPQNLLPL